MPKIIDNIRNGRPPLTPSPGDIEAKIADAEAQLSATDPDYSRAALEAEGGVPGAADRFAAVVERRKAIAGRLEMLRSALAAAQADERAHQARQRAKLFKDNLAKITAAFTKRDDAAQRLSDHIAGAAQAYRDLLELSDKAALPLPGVSIPAGSLIGTGELRRAVERELYRLGATALDHRRNFPGGKSHDIELLDAPERLPALVDVVKEASAFALATVSAGAPA
jgi:hypothetical protein